MKTDEQKRIKVSVRTGNGVVILPGMLDKAKYSVACEILNSGAINLFGNRNISFEKRLRPLRTLDVYDSIDGCSIIISAGIGKKGVTELRRRMRLIFKHGIYRTPFRQYKIYCDADSGSACGQEEL